MLFSVLKEFPRKLTAQDKSLVSRHLGVAIWIGVFASLTILLILCLRLENKPELSYRMAVNVGATSVVEAIVGYLLYIGIFIKE